MHKIANTWVSSSLSLVGSSLHIYSECYTIVVGAQMQPCYSSDW
jgi:hypothetical protein